MNTVVVVEVDLIGYDEVCLILCVVSEFFRLNADKQFAFVTDVFIQIVKDIREKEEIIKMIEGI